MCICREKTVYYACGHIKSENKETCTYAPACTGVRAQGSSAIEDCNDCCNLSDSKSSRNTSYDDEDMLDVEDDMLQVGVQRRRRRPTAPVAPSWRRPLVSNRNWEGSEADVEESDEEANKRKTSEAKRAEVMKRYHSRGNRDTEYLRKKTGNRVTEFHQDLPRSACYLRKKRMASKNRHAFKRNPDFELLKTRRKKQVYRERRSHKLVARSKAYQVTLRKKRRCDNSLADSRRAVLDMPQSYPLPLPPSCPTTPPNPSRLPCDQRYPATPPHSYQRPTYPQAPCSQSPCAQPTTASLSRQPLVEGSLQLGEQFHGADEGLCEQIE